jgi:hypothetical protein
MVPPHCSLDLLDAHRVLGARSAARIDDACSRAKGPFEGETALATRSDLTSDGGRGEPGGESRSGVTVATIDTQGGVTAEETLARVSVSRL